MKQESKKAPALSTYRWLFVAIVFAFKPYIDAFFSPQDEKIWFSTARVNVKSLPTEVLTKNWGVNQQQTDYVAGVDLEFKINLFGSDFPQAKNNSRILKFIFNFLMVAIFGLFADCSNLFFEKKYQILIRFSKIGISISIFSLIFSLVLTQNFLVNVVFIEIKNRFPMIQYFDNSSFTFGFAASLIALFGFIFLNSAAKSLYTGVTTDDKVP